MNIRESIVRGMISVEEAAAVLGVKASTVRSWILHRKISYTKVGRSVRIDPAECERIISEGTMPAKRSLAS